jgi:hypothetical protein
MTDTANRLSLAALRTRRYQAESRERTKAQLRIKTTYDESTEFCEKLMSSSLAPTRTPQLRDSREPEKLNNAQIRLWDDSTAQHSSC